MSEFSEREREDFDRLRNWSECLERWKRDGFLKSGTSSEPPEAFLLDKDETELPMDGYSFAKWMLFLMIVGCGEGETVEKKRGGRERERGREKRER